MDEVKPISAEAVAPLLRWYEENKRDLPWRHNPTPYRVWVSEIMLQQTRVETVKPYYERWMNALPTLEDLANADEETVLKLWEGLGYYSRARNLKKAAEKAVVEYGGVPSAWEDLCRLPGVGVYTAGAISSIAFGYRQPAVDGNVLRVVSRLNADGFDCAKDAVRAAVADRLRPLMPEGKCSEFTQALFEIGALICLPDDGYRCEICPLKELCLSKRDGVQPLYPVKVPKPEKKTERKTVFLIEYQGRYALKKRLPTGLLANLYEFPNIDGFVPQTEVSLYCSGTVTSLGKAKHVFTHIVWEMAGYKIVTDDPPPENGWVFVTPEETEEGYPIPSAFGFYKKFIKKKSR